VAGASVRRAQDAAVLTIGRDVWTRTEFATTLGLTHVVAAARVTWFAQAEGISSLAELVRDYTPEDVASAGARGAGARARGRVSLGAVSIYVLLCAIDARLGAGATEAWYARARLDVRTWATTATRARARGARAASPTARRKARA
jgi:hypothetical protein